MGICSSTLDTGPILGHERHGPPHPVATLGAMARMPQHIRAIEGTAAVAATLNTRGPTATAEDPC